MSARHSRVGGMRLLVTGGGVAYRQREELTRDRLPGLVLAALVVLVQVTWGGMLVYLGFHFL